MKKYNPRNTSIETLIVQLDELRQVIKEKDQSMIRLKKRNRYS